MKTNIITTVLLLFLTIGITPAHPVAFFPAATGAAREMAPPPPISLTLHNYESALQKSGIYQIDGKVFLRNTTLSADIVAGCTPAGLTVNILQENGTTVAALTATTTTSVSGGSSVAGVSWNIPSVFPVGAYSMRVKCGSQIVEEKFYVIFNPSEVGSFPQFSYKNKVAVWFDTRNNESPRAWTYQLHPNDKRVFNRAIQSVQGQTNIKSAAVALARAEESFFGYTAAWQASDVVTMLKRIRPGHPQPLAQCADDAAVLVAMLRAVGICAYTVTVDADRSTSPFTWDFDTWVEFLVPDALLVQRWILHPHEYPGMPPENRSTFGTSTARPVARRNGNDIILMANFPSGSVPSAVGNSTAEFTFGRQSCDKPEAVIVHPTWISKLCEDYWAPNHHWDCFFIIADNSITAGVNNKLKQVNSPGSYFSVDTTDISYGRQFSGEFSFVYSSTSQFPINTPITLQLLADNPRGKLFGDTVLDSVTGLLKLSADGMARLPYKLRLPTSLPANFEDIYLVALAATGDSTVTKNRYAIVEEFIVPKPLLAKVYLENDLSESKKYKVKVDLSNNGTFNVDSIEVGIIVPYAICLNSKPTQTIAIIRPGETRFLEFSVCTAQPMTAGTVEVDIVSKNGGSRKDYTRVTITPAPVVKKKNWLDFLWKK